MPLQSQTMVGESHTHVMDRDTPTGGSASPRTSYAHGMTGYTRWWRYIQQHLDARGWSPSELARQAGINRSIVGRWKNEGAKPELDTAKAVSIVLGRPLVEILLETEQVTPEQMGVERIVVSPLSECTDEQLWNELQQRFAAYRAQAGHGDATDTPESSATWISRVHKADSTEPVDD